MGGVIVDLKNFANVSINEQLARLERAMLAKIGYAPEHIEVDGELHRFDTEKRNDKTGWYVVHVEQFGVVAVFGDWRQGETHKFYGFSQDKLSASQLRAFKRREAQRKKTREAEEARRQDEASYNASDLYSAAGCATNANAYAQKKNINIEQAELFVRQERGDLLVPLMDWNGELWNIQRIKPDGSKLFLSGGKVKGLFNRLGNAWISDGGVYVCEGFATACSVFSYFNAPTYAAFNASNLFNVVQGIRARWHTVPITIVADNDRKRGAGQNTGVNAAKKAQEAVNGVSLIIPMFPRNHEHLSDFNDWINFVSSNKTHLVNHAWLNKDGDKLDVVGGVA